MFEISVWCEDQKRKANIQSCIPLEVYNLLEKELIGDVVIVDIDSNRIKRTSRYFKFMSLYSSTPY